MKMKEIQIPLWDRNGRTVLDCVTVRGTARKIHDLEQQLERVKFSAHPGGEPRVQTASEFTRRHRII